MKKKDVLKQYTTPVGAPAFVQGPHRFRRREYLNITYRTDREAVEGMVPEPLEIDQPRIRTIDEKGQLTVATANRALSNGDGSEVQLFGNAVVVRDVPPGATAVGIPARIVEDRSEIAREIKAGQMGFSAYAVTRNEDDPLSQAIHGLLDHAVETDRRLEMLLKCLEQSGVCKADELATADKFDPQYLSKIVD